MNQDELRTAQHAVIHRFNDACSLGDWAGGLSRGDIKIDDALDHRLVSECKISRTGRRWCIELRCGDIVTSGSGYTVATAIADAMYAHADIAKAEAKVMNAKLEEVK